MKMENYIRVNGQSDYEQYKNIKGRWRLSIFSAFSSGAGAVKNSSLIRDTALKNYNKVVIGEIGNGKGYHKI